MGRGVFLLLLMLLDELRHDLWPHAVKVSRHLAQERRLFLQVESHNV
jgi:hypothetical protein